MSRLIVTDDGTTYEQRTAGTSNTGGTLTEVREVFEPEMDMGGPYVPDPKPWSLLDPAQAEPRVGDRWTLRHAHGRYTLTDVVNEIIGGLDD